MTSSREPFADVRWEHGSEFHWPDIPPSASFESPWHGNSALFGSGRDALRAVVEHGREQLGWQRLWTPTYFCQEVIAAAAQTGIQLCAYSDAPGSLPDFRDVQVRAGDAVFIANYFGLRSSLAPPDGAAIVEDHTHDPWSQWSRRSVADFCLVSLRKTLPVPDGAVVWSPRQHTLPSPRAVTGERAAASSSKLAAMLLKRLYFEGHAVLKERFRELYLAGEEQIASGVISGMPAFTKAVLGTFPAREWRLQRLRNHQAFLERLHSSHTSALQVLRPQGDADMVPFSIVLVTDGLEHRDALRRCLMAKDIYPAVLWPLERAELGSIPEAHVDLSRRILSLHCDFRYSEADLVRVAESVLAVEAESV